MKIIYKGEHPNLTNGKIYLAIRELVDFGLWKLKDDSVWNWELSKKRSPDSYLIRDDLGTLRFAPITEFETIPEVRDRKIGEMI